VYKNEQIFFPHPPFSFPLAMNEKPVTSETDEENRTVQEEKNKKIIATKGHPFMQSGSFSNKPKPK
jgi:hypothetical protein